MASNQDTSWYKPLELAITCNNEEVLRKGLEDVAKDLKRDLTALKRYIRREKELDYVTLTDVSFKDGRIFLYFELKNEVQLNNLFELLKQKDNKLSKCMTKYCYDKSIEVIAGLAICTEMKCSVHMTKKTYHQCQVNLCAEEDSSDIEDDSATKKGPTSIQQSTHLTESVEKRVEKINQMSSHTEPGSYSSRKNPPVDEVRTNMLLKLTESVEKRVEKINQSSSQTEHGSNSNKKYPPVSDVHANILSKEPTFSKKLLLFYPERNETLKIFVSSSCNTYLNGQMHFHGIFKHGVIYELDINIPLSKLERNDKFVYKFFSRSTLQKVISSLFPIDAFETSKEYKLNEHTIQRDVWRGKEEPIRDVHAFDEKWVLGHLMDIIFHCINFHRISDCCMEIEALIPFLLPPSYALNVIKALAEDLSQMEPICSVLFTIAIGTLLGNPSRLLLRPIIDPQLARLVIKNISCTQVTLHELPVSCQKYIHSTCSAICKVGYGSAIHEIITINACYAFYGDTFLLSLVQGGKIFESMDAESKSFKALTDLCLQLYENAVHDNTAAHGILGSIMRRLPISIALNVYSEMYKSDVDDVECEHNLQSTLYGTINVQIENVIKALKKQRTSALESLEKSIADVYKHEKVWGIFKSKFVDAYISIVGASSRDQHVGSPEITKCLLIDYGLFSMNKDKHRIIKVIMESPNEYILEQFIKLSELTQLNDIFCSLSVDEFQLFCERYLYAKAWSSRYNDDKLRPLMMTLSTLWNIPFVSNNEALSCTLVKISLMELDKLDIRKLMTSIDTVSKQSLSTPKIADVFLMHVHKKIYGESERPEFLLNMMETRNDVLCLNTKLSADVVSMLLDEFGLFHAADSILAKFERMVDRYQFWTTIFNCTGEFSHCVTRHENYNTAMQCIKGMVNMFQKHEIQYDFIMRMGKNTRRIGAAKRLLGHHLDVNEVEKVWTESGKMFTKELERLDCVANVMTVLIQNEPRLEKEFSSVINRMKKMENQLKSGLLTAGDCEDGCIIWNDMDDLPRLCKDLSGYVHSSVFWNICRNGVYEQYTLQCKQNPYDDTLRCIQRLFLDSSSDEDDGGIDSFCIIYIQILFEMGCKHYHDMWIDLTSNDTFGMNQIQLMFGPNPDVQKEINQAKKILHLFVDKSTTNTLIRIYSIDSVAEKVEAIEKLFVVFELDPTEDETYNEAITAYHQLLTGTAESSTFKDVKSALETVFILGKNRSENAFNVMISLGKASTLIQFLKTIVEEDIKNLIDAVEDISEQQVQESTVSALIEVKQFLHPLLLFQSNGKCTKILEILDRQVVSCGPNCTYLPPKIDDCVQNVHNLKSLYNGLANRSEQTKDLVRMILKNGTYCFQLSKNYNQVEFDVSYVQNESIEIRKKSTLIDLRSRALLLMNTSRAENHEGNISDNELMSFIRDIDICIDIAEALFSLYIAGHVSYIDIHEKVISCELLEQKEKMNNNLCKWQTYLAKERENHYLMNFLYGNQIHILHKYLEEQEVDVQSVNVILTFIHPDVDLLTVKAKYKDEKLSKLDLDHRHMLHCMGHALHSTYEGIHVRRRALNDNRSNVLANLVQPGKLMVAQLDEGSLHTVKTLLSLYINTTQCLPEPNHILFCTRETSWIELELLIQRCLGAYNFYRMKTLFCIAHVEMLPGELQFKLVETLRHLERGAQYLLAVICRGSRNHPFVDELSDCVSAVKPVTDRTLQDIFQTHCSNVHTLTSEVAGQGKSSYIQTVAKKMKLGVVKLHVSGQLNKVVLVERINHLAVRNYHVLHIDIGSVDEPSELDTFLFELVVLNYVSAGRTAVKLESQNIYIELANTINDTLRNSLHTTVLFQRIKLHWGGIEEFLISREIHSPVQIVCHYLKHLENGSLDSVDLNFEHRICKPISKRKCRMLLKKYIFKTQIDAFPIMHNAINVLADQLKKMSQSSFFKVSRLREMVGNKSIISVKSKLVMAMIEVAIEFASRSVANCRETQVTTVNPMVEEHDQRRNVSKTSHDIASSITSRTDGMIRWEDSNHLMFVFHNQNVHTLSALYRHLTKVPSDIRLLFESQMKKKMVDFSGLEQTHFQDLLQKIARINPMPLEKERLMQLSKNYALTADNLLKMVLIMLRIKANIPVLVMGETGCGKTSLIRYLASVCEVDFEVLNIHAGIPEDEIIRCVMYNNTCAIQNIDKERWFFLDEINTSGSIGLMSDVICHHSCLGLELSPNLVVMGACNPYKLRTTKDISTAGLEGKVKTDELSRLVYRVLPLPEIMVDYVWDFGSLNEKDEEKYIHRMIHDVFPGNKKYHVLFTGLLSVSQTFVRVQEESHYSVSLRDVQRCKLLSEWFIEVLPKKSNNGKGKTTKIDVHLRAMILSLAHCYHSRFSLKSVRKEYRIKIGEMFLVHGLKFVDCQESFINSVIKEEQADILGRMKLPPGIACNTALRENVFIILVCIFNKIPIFVVGKPGCSKSLAMQLIKSNLRGKDSEDDFFKKLPQLYCVSFQGSESSTSDGIVKVFRKAENYQDSNRSGEVLSVVILDEIGLAEVSRFNPLKVLHSLLEPEGQSQPNVAVVGISNWALDASKMNRAIHLSRPDMDEEELYETALSISESFLKKDKKATSIFGKSEVDNIQSCESISKDLQGMAKAYCQYIEQLRFKHFHGLRDYYSLVKYVSRLFANSDHPLSEIEMADVVMNGIARNFGGLPEEKHTLYDVFKRYIPSLKSNQTPLLDIVAENITDPIARHLMLITTGESVLGILEQKLKTMNTKQKEIIFGSQFEEDLTDDYNYRILSKIILCMEQGLILVLKDLDSIYGSLYDMLNQNYTVIGKKKNCRVALGPYSNPICHVADNFRCIVLIDESKLDLTDPPFLNRFEKQYLRFSDILQDKHTYLIREIESWVEQLSNNKTDSMKRDDLFPIYNRDLIASLVLKMESDSEEQFEKDIIMECKQLLLMIMKPEAIVRQRKTSKLNDIDSNKLIEQYFGLPIHNGLEYFLLYQLENVSDENLNEGILTVIFTNSNVHTKIRCNDTNIHLQVEKLGAFKSEKQLTGRVQLFWDDANCNHLIVQCSAREEEHHILLTKLIIERCRKDYKEQSNKICKHVYIIIHLDRNDVSSESLSQLNFLSDWNLVMLDCLESPRIPLPRLYRMSLLEAIHERRPLINDLKEQLLWAFSRIRYETCGRDVESISRAIEKIEESKELLEILESEIFDWIQCQYSDVPDRYWPCEVASDVTALQSSSGFIDALEQYIMGRIKTPLAKLIYQIELSGMLDSFFTIPEDVEVICDKRKIWISCLQNKCAMSLKDILDVSGPECYTCSTHDYQLKMPCSKRIYEAIETTKPDFMDMLRDYKLSCLLDEEELPEEVFNEVLNQQEGFILDKIPDLNDYIYPTWNDDYYDDFCIMTTASVLAGIDNLKRKPFMKHILNRQCVQYENDSFAYVVRLHTIVWAHYDSIRSELLLIDNCLNKMIESEYVLLNVLSSVETAGYGMSNCELVNSDEENTCDENFQESSIEQFMNERSEESTSNDVTSFELCDFFDIFEDDDVCNRSDISEPISNVSESIRNSTSEEDICMDLSKKLVVCVCEQLLPTKRCLTLHGGISNWLLVADTTVSLAAQVSRDPPLLYSLKTSSELGQELIVGFELDPTFIENVGEILLTNPLDSEDVFKAVMNIIEVVLKDKTCPCNENMFICYQTLSSYFVRCISANPCTMIINKLFELVVEDKIVKQCISLFKVPIDLIIQNIDEDLFMNVLENSDWKNVKHLHTEDVDIETDIKILTAVDDMVDCLFINGRTDSPMLVMLTDILETLFTKMFFSKLYSVTNKGEITSLSGTDEEIPMTSVFADQNVVDLLYCCHKTLASLSHGLQYVASVAFCKCFLLYAVQSITTGTDDDSTRMMNILDIVLTDLLKNMEHGYHSLIVYLFKLLSEEKTLVQLQQFCDAHKEQYMFLKPFEFDSSDSQKLHNSVLCIHVNEDDHEQLCFSGADISSSYKDSVLHLVEKANEGKSGLLQLFTFVLREFYFYQCITDLNDTKRTQADILLNECMNSHMREEIITYIRCIIGKDNFKVTHFSLEKSSSQQHICVFTFILNFIALTLAHDSFKDHDHGETSFLAKALCDPKSLGGSFIPGFARHYQPRSDVDVRYIAICECGYKIFVLTKFEKFSCGFCDSELKLSDDPMLETGLYPELEQDADPEVNDTSSETNMFACNNNPATYHVLQFLVKSCMFGSVALGYSKIAAIHAFFKRPVDETNDMLLDEVLEHWESIEKLVNVNHNETCILLHALLRKAEDLLFTHGSTFNSIEEISAYEECFDKLVMEIFGEKTNSLLCLHKKHISMHLHSNNERNLGDQLFELEDLLTMSEEESVHKVSCLYRFTTSPTKTNFMFELKMKKHQFPLLEEFFLQETLLSLPVHIMRILAWHSAAVANASYMIRKQECLRMSAQDFVYFKQDTMKKDVMKRRFDEFRESWEILKKELKDSKVGKDMIRIHSETKMSDCLLLEENSVIFRVLVALIAIQNRFLDTVARIARSSKSLKTFTKGDIVAVPCVPLNELKREDLLDIKLDWNCLLVEESQCNLAYGHGRQVHYDFYRIEECIAREVVSGKKYITCVDNLPKIIFIDELHLNYASLVKEIKENVKQCELPSDVCSGILSRKEEDPRMPSELLNHLGVVMTVVKRMKADPEQPLVEFVDSWKSTMCRKFPKALLPKPETSVKLCHVVALSELLEELCAETIRDGLADKYRQSLDTPLHDHLVKILKDESLASVLLKAFKRFTFRCLASSTADPDQSIRLYLADESFWPNSAFHDNKVRTVKTEYLMSDLLPDGLMVRHVSDCFDVINKEIEKRQKGNMKLSGFASSFQNRNINPHAQRFVQKKKKAVNTRRF